MGEDRSGALGVRSAKARKLKIELADEEDKIRDLTAIGFSQSENLKEDGRVSKATPCACYGLISKKSLLVSLCLRTSGFAM